MRHAFALFAVALLLAPVAAAPADRFEGASYRGEGDVEYLQLLDIARRMFDADPEFQSVGMLYTPAWNGLVEGPTWNAWWIQNSYGPTYCALPFLEEPLATFLQNAQDLWFDQMGDGARRSAHDWVAPDGCLCDAARPGWFMPKQGDGRVDIHDWGLEFTAAGLLMQAELLLIRRDPRAIRRYLPKLERCAAFIETRRDPETDLFLAGPAGNLLAPSYAGWKKPDGSYGMAYLAGLSVTYIAALDRLIELEKLAGRAGRAAQYAERRGRARAALPRLLTDEGYLIKSLDPDGTRHGVHGAKVHGYFEAVCNHDAICFRVVDDEQAARIYAKIASIPGLRPHDLIITNYPTLDDMYVPAAGWLWKFGTWVNGGHWSTCEARMIMGYYRVGAYEDARRSMRKILDFARRFRLDNPLVAFGSAVYQPHEPVNLCYDSFGPSAALIRGLFEYIYRAEGLTLIPHIPPGIRRIEQRFPIRLGAKRLWIAAAGAGPITAVTVNGAPWPSFDARSVTLPYDRTPDVAAIQILLGGAEERPFVPRTAARDLPPLPPADPAAWRFPRYDAITTNRLPLRIGADSGGGSRFVGEIARARIFRRALSAGEIAQLARSRSASAKDPRDLVADWTFARPEEKGFPDAGGPGMVAKIVGEVESVEGPDGPAVRLAGRGWLEVAHDPRLDLREACTLDAWIRPDVLPKAGGRIIDKSRAGTANGYLLDTFPGNSLRLIVERGTLLSAAKLAPGRWVHVAATVAADATQALYIDGRLVASQKRGLAMDVAPLVRRVARLRAFCARLRAAGLGGSYEAAHARLAVRYLAALRTRLERLAEGTLAPLPPPSQYAADRSYFDTVARLCEGLEKVIATYREAAEPRKRRVYEIWCGG